jgi:glutamate carboxypeptidase
MPASSEQINRYFQERLPDYLSLLEQMVSINSFTANASGVNQLGELTAEAFTWLGFHSRRVQSSNPNYGRHLFLHRPSSQDNPPGIIMVSHLDTVFPAQEEIDNHFHWRVEGDRIYGPGSVDIKGGSVMILMVLDAIHQFFPQLMDQISWLLAFDASEEVLSDDFGKLLRQTLEPATLACLVFEGGTPVNGRVSLVVARKGRASFRIKVQGRSAHAGNRHAQGANAIIQIAHTVQQVAALTDYDKNITFNVGTIRGGSVVNRVPHYAEAEVEMRAFAPPVFESGVSAILALNGACQVTSQDGYPCNVQVLLQDETPPWPRNSQTNHLFDIWRQTGEKLNMLVVPEERGGLSDGNMVWEVVPTLDGLGPVGNNAHCSERSPDGSKDQEYVQISSFIPKALLNTLALVHLLEKSAG